MNRLGQEASPGAARLSAAQMAYGLLWREMRVSDKPYVRQARAVLLASLSTADQQAAIAWVQAKYPITENEIDSEASGRRSSEGSSREDVASGQPAASSGRAPQ